MVPSHRPNSLHAFHGTWLVTPVTDDPGVPKKKVPPAQVGTAVPISASLRPPLVGAAGSQFQEPRAERMNPGAGQGEREQAKDSQLRQLM